MQKQWKRREINNPELVNELIEGVGVNSLLASIMAQRGIVNFKSAKAYVNPSQDQLHDPFLMKGMSPAVDRIIEAVAKNQKILFYGDYDVDGTTSVALMRLFFGTFYTNFIDHIPDRHKEGYGISSVGVARARDEKVDLVIAMDCGIRAVQIADELSQLGIGLIICDHHQPGEKLPNAIAVLDPKREDCPYPYKELSGCGLSFKLCCAIAQRMPDKKLNPFEYIDLIALSIASDIVPITGENRVLAYFGLKKINNKPIPGLKAMKEKINFKKAYTISDVVFKIGPRINAAGRVNHGIQSVRLLSGKAGEDLDELVDLLESFNLTRRELEHQVVQEGLEQIEADFEGFNRRKSIVLFGESWNKGVIGIAASKLIERYYKPTVVLTKSDEGMAVGSARSVEGFDLYTALSSCDELFTKFGGHRAAAGLSIPIANIPAFLQKFDDIVRATILPLQEIPCEWYDFEIDLSQANTRFYNSLMRLGPFGPGNMRPTFVSRSLENVSYRIVGEKHLKLSIPVVNTIFDGIAFNFAPIFDELNEAESIDICYVIEQNEWMGKKSLQLLIKDIKPTKI